MATKTVTWCGDELDCSEEIPTTAYLCVPASLVVGAVDEDLGIVEATVTAVRDSKATDSCGRCKKVYTFTYDDAQIVEGFTLSTASINSVLCKNCLTVFVQQEAAEDPLPADFCWNFADDEIQLLTLNTAGVGGIAVSDTIVLTANATITLPLQVLPCGLIDVDTFTLTLDHFVPTGDTQFFDTSADGKVSFSEGSIDAVKPQWFGALADGVNNDCDPFRSAIASYKHIYLNQGTYLISPTTASGDFMLYLGTANGNADRSGMTIEGAGPGSVVKLGDAAGRNRLLFGAGLADSLSDMTFKNFKIDLNGANNLQEAYADPLRYNSAFYMYCYCENFKFEDLIVVDASGSQVIRIGDDTAGHVGKDIQFKSCTFDNFGIGLTGNLIQDCSVLYLEADNVLVENCTFRNADFTFNLSKGQTAIELHGKNSSKIVGNFFEYLQLPLLIASTEQAAVNTLVHNNVFRQTNYLLSVDTASAGHEQSRIIISNNTYNSNKTSSIVIPIGLASEAARTRAQIEFLGNVMDGTGGAVQGAHIFRIESAYLNNLVIQDNDIANFLGVLVYFAGAAVPTTVGEIKIVNNRLDSLGQTGGAFPATPTFVVIAPTSNTLNSLIIDGNDVFNTAAKNYSALGVWRRSGNITYCYINDTKNHLSSAYPLITGTLGTNTFRYESVFPKNQPELFPYVSAPIAIGAATNVNIADFSVLNVNEQASFIMSLNLNDGANNGVATYSITAVTTGFAATLIAQSGTVGASAQFNFSGSMLRARNNSGGAMTGIFTVLAGFTSEAITWLY